MTPSFRVNLLKIIAQCLLSFLRLRYEVDYCTIAEISSDDFVAFFALSHSLTGHWDEFKRWA